MKAYATVLAICATMPIAACDRSDGTSETAQGAPVQILLSDAIDVRGGMGRYVNAEGGAKTEIVFPLAADRIDVTRFHDVERIGERGDLIAVLDTYGSRGGQRCADGRESWLRIFALSARRQVEAIPVESCRDGLRAGDPPITWRDDGFTIGARRFVLEGDQVRRLEGGRDR